jgi:hypothetical protein
MGSHSRAACSAGLLVYSTSDRVAESIDPDLDIDCISAMTALGNPFILGVLGTCSGLVGV